MTKDSIELICAIAALIIGGAALTVASIALAFIVGVKNSTHQVVWKPLEASEEEADAFTSVQEEVESHTENPNKKFNNFKNDLPKEEVEFEDLSDPSVTSNNW